MYNSKPQSGLVSLTVRHKPPVNVRIIMMKITGKFVAVLAQMFISSLGAESRHTVATHLLGTERKILNFSRKRMKKQ